MIITNTFSIDGKIGDRASSADEATVYERFLTRINKTYKKQGDELVDNIILCLSKYQNAHYDKADKCLADFISQYPLIADELSPFKTITERVLSCEKDEIDCLYEEYLSKKEAWEKENSLYQLFHKEPFLDYQLVHKRVGSVDDVDLMIRCKYCGHYTERTGQDRYAYCNVCNRMDPSPTIKWDNIDGQAYRYYEFYEYDEYADNNDGPYDEFYDEFEKAHTVLVDKFGWTIEERLEEEVRPLIEKATELFKNEQYDEAIKIYKEVDNSYDEFESTNDVHVDKGDNALEERLKEAWKPLVETASDLYENEQYDEAIKIYEKIIEKDENSTEAYCGIISVLIGKEVNLSENHSKELINLYEKLEKLDVNKIDDLLFARALDEDGQYDRALKYYNIAKDDKDYDFLLTDIYRDIGDIFSRQKEYVKAIKSYDKVIEISIDENGDDSYIVNIYALQRELYKKIADSSMVLEMERKFEKAEKLQKGTEKDKEDLNNELRVKLSKASSEEDITELLDSFDELEQIDADEHERLYQIVLETINLSHNEEKISIGELEEIIETILSDVDYDNEEEEAIVKKLQLLIRVKRDTRHILY